MCLRHTATLWVKTAVWALYRIGPSNNGVSIRDRIGTEIDPKGSPPEISGQPPRKDVQASGAAHASMMSGKMLEMSVFCKKNLKEW